MSIFTPQIQDTLLKYFKREINAANAANKLGWFYNDWAALLAGVFSKGNCEVEIID